MLVEIESENFQDNWLDVISYQIVLSIKDGLACYFRMDLPFTRAQKCNSHLEQEWSTGGCFLIDSPKEYTRTQIKCLPELPLTHNLGHTLLSNQVANQAQAIF